MKNNTVEVTASFPYCSGDKRYEGIVEVVQVDLGQSKKTVAMRLRTSARIIPIPRHRIKELVAALEAAGDAASRQYTEVLEELNPS